MSPHLFTHLFREGVIISTRKLVYDAGSDEGAIKSLMQAQHKAVMKDLKKGTFDDKIDLYLVGTPGLLPRGAIETGDEGAAAAEMLPSDRSVAAVRRRQWRAGAAVAAAATTAGRRCADAGRRRRGRGRRRVRGQGDRGLGPTRREVAARPRSRTARWRRTTSGVEAADRDRQRRSTTAWRTSRSRRRAVARRATPISRCRSIPASKISAPPIAPPAMLDVGPTMPNLSPADPGAVHAADERWRPAAAAVVAAGLSRTGPTGAPERRTLDRIPAVSSASLPPIPTRASTKPPTAATAAGLARGDRRCRSSCRGRSPRTIARATNPMPPRSTRRPRRRSRHRRARCPSARDSIRSIVAANRSR